MSTDTPARKAIVAVADSLDFIANEHVKNYFRYRPDSKSDHDFLPATFKAQARSFKQAALMCRNDNNAVKAGQDAEAWLLERIRAEGEGGEVSWFYSYDGMDGSFEFHREEPKSCYGKLYGPFNTFAMAKADLIKRVKDDMSELKLTLLYVKEARAKDTP